MKLDDYRFYPPTLTTTINGKRVKKLMAIHKVTGETFFFSAEEIEEMSNPPNKTLNPTAE